MCDGGVEEKVDEGGVYEVGAEVPCLDQYVLIGWVVYMYNASDIEIIIITHAGLLFIICRLY